MIWILFKCSHLIAKKKFPTDHVTKTNLKEEMKIEDKVISHIL